MTDKQLKQIAAGLVVLLALWGLSELLSGRSDPTAGSRIFQPVPEARVDSIVIRRPDDTIRLVKRPGYWVVNGHRASSTEVAGLFTQLADTTLPEVAGESRAVHARMGLGEDSARQVQVFSGGTSAIDLLVGSRGPDYQSSYVRKPGDDRVYLRFGPFAGYLDRAVDDWRERRMASIPVDSARRVDITRHGRRYSLVRKDARWQFADGRPADSVLTQKLLRSLSPATATGFASAEEAKKISFARPDLRVVVIGTHNDTLIHLLGDSMPNGYWVRNDSGGPIFRNGVWIADEITPHDSTLRARP